MNYYNEHDKFAADWLENLIRAGLLPSGDVDRRDIQEVSYNDIKKYTQCHFFAGIGGWSLALQLAGWPTNRPIWTGSCPCQPFSVAGKGRGNKDERHLWPEFRRLIEAGNPPVVIGEQVAAKAGRSWLSGVRSEMEALGYGFGAADLCVAGINAPHIRQRLFWVADTISNAERGAYRGEIRDSGDRRQSKRERSKVGDDVADSSEYSGISNSKCVRCNSTSESITGSNGETIISRGSKREQEAIIGESGKGCCQVDIWNECVLIPCGDGKARRIKPGITPLVNGVPGRVGQLRGYGNAIVPQLAAEFIMAYMNIKGIGIYETI